MVLAINNQDYFLEISGASNLFEDEYKLVDKFAHTFMKKVTKLSDYDNLRLTFKSVGNINGSHLRKVEVSALLSKGNHILSVKNAISTGTSDELTNNKVKANYNVPKLTQDTLNQLGSKLKAERRK